MEGWDRKANWNRDVLERVVALLFALAGLADLAAGAPFLRRRHVLGILSRGEAEARAFVMDISTSAPVPVDGPGEAGLAVRLAASFRALALVLCAMLALAEQFVPPAAVTGPRTGRQALYGLPAPDTS